MNGGKLINLPEVIKKQLTLFFFAILPFSEFAEMNDNNLLIYL